MTVKHDDLYSLCDSHDKIENAMAEVKNFPEWSQIQVEFDRMLKVIGSVEGDIAALAVAAYIRITNRWEDFQ